MEGIPDDVMQSHNARVSQEFWANEANRRASSGNPGPNGQASNGAKKPKIETSEELKKRLAEHKAKKAAAAEAGTVNSGSNTPAVSEAILER